MNCNHDYECPIRESRAKFLCRKCGKDITLMIVMLEETKKDENYLESKLSIAAKALTDIKNSLNVNAFCYFVASSALNSIGANEAIKAIEQLNKEKHD